jgi:hypothetical protein
MWPGWGHLEPFHDNENELIPSYIGKAVEAHIKRVESANAELNEVNIELFEALETLLEEGDTNSTAVLCAEQAVAKAKGESE